MQRTLGSIEHLEHLIFGSAIPPLILLGYYGGLHWLVRVGYLDFTPWPSEIVRIFVNNASIIELWTLQIDASI